MPIIRREELIELTNQFLWRLNILAEVLTDICQHRSTTHEEEVLYNLRITSDELRYELLVGHGDTQKSTKNAHNDATYINVINKIDSNNCTQTNICSLNSFTNSFIVLKF